MHSRSISPGILVLVLVLLVVVVVVVVVLVVPLFPPPGTWVWYAVSKEPGLRLAFLKKK